MASLNLFLAPVLTTQRRVVRTGATASKASGSSNTEEKGVFDFVLGALAKQEQIYETDPILKKVEKKNAGGTTSRNTPVSGQPEKKNGGFDFGGLFSKK
ncbi:hypothetical protein F511_06231 [Dorcoceras hygrometricum]|uniref:Thylakoid soluble phosphoprotein TSP9 n=1 Tax=Dorcoceras hygrometricum TaxID=472368 RepID=A0A2Z7B5F2_9LAMI|nr:hypothetical protein F511_06231 [Dorcoceras hygrometricum]